MNKEKLLICLLILSNIIFMSAQAVWQAADPNLPEPLNVLYLNNAGSGVFWGIGIKGNFNKQLWEYDESYSYILRTNNNGSSGVWNRTRFPRDSNIVGSLSAKSFTRAWLLTYDLPTKESRVWRTLNGAASWQPLEIGISNTSYLNVIQMWNLNRGVILGDPVNGKFEIFKTANGGSYWLKSENAPAAEKGEIGIICIYYATAKSLYMPTTKGRLLYTNDMGDTWNISKTPLDFAEFISFKNDDEGVIALNNYNVYPFKTQIVHTKDGGKTWDSPINADFAFFDLKYIPNTPYLMGTTREKNDKGPFKTVISEDDGLTWRTIDEGTPIASFLFTDDGIGIGGMFKKDNFTSTKMYRFNFPENLPVRPIKK